MVKMSENRGQQMLTKALSGSCNEMVQAVRTSKNNWMWLQKSVHEGKKLRDGLSSLIMMIWVQNWKKIDGQGEKNELGAPVKKDP